VAAPTATPPCVPTCFGRESDFFIDVKQTALLAEGHALVGELMLEAALRSSDEVIVTSDYPRSEDPGRITLDVEVGVRRARSDHYQIILDREQAIATAFSMAGPSAIVLIAGKGHENYQIMADRTIPFDDREVTRRLLKKLK